MEAAREVDKPKEEEDVTGSGNVFSEFFVPLTGDINDGQAASDTSAAVFFQYLYDAAKLGSSSAADLIAQWVGAADEDGATSKGAEFLAAFIAPQGDDTVVSKEAKPEKQDGVFANFFGGDEEDTEATINTNYGNILKNWLNLEDWGIPEDMKVAISQVFGDESGEAESGDMKSQSQGLISPKDTRYISLLKKKLRQLELRGRGKGLSRPLLASGEKFTFRRAVQAATKTIAKAEPSIVKAKAECCTASNKNSFIPTSAAVSTKAPVVTSSSAVSQEPRSTEKPQANGRTFSLLNPSLLVTKKNPAGFDFNIKEFLSSVRADSLADHLSNLHVCNRSRFDEKGEDTFKEEKPLNWVRGNPEVVRQHGFYQDEEVDGSSSCLMGWYGVDPTYDKWCAEKCASGCCLHMWKVSTHCTCVNPEARLTSGDSAGRCVSPRTCKTQEYTAVPGTYATDSWCASVCSPSSPSNELCSCTLCECSITCGSGIPNGDFEQGLKGWSLVRQRGSRGATITTLKSTAEDYEHNDIRGPLSGKTIPAIPPSRASSSSRMAVMDFASPGSLILYREYTPVKGDIIKFRWAAVNWARDFYVQYDTTSANVVRNQHFRVDIIDATAASSIRKPMNWFETTSPTNFRETSTSSILASALSPDKVKNVMNAIGEPPFRDSEPWQTSRFDLSPFAGRKLLVVFRAVANQGPMSVVIDDVGIVNDACTPPTHNLAASPFISRLPDPVAVDVDGMPCSDVCGLEFSK
ncbi:hypothetical protein BC829DRAFT_400519 [Chytridium lagenaria]|nr:hypothetical protein BC829DRAFT_400519 [Chytridium lagenaria]